MKKIIQFILRHKIKLLIAVILVFTVWLFREDIFYKNYSIFLPGLGGSCPVKQHRITGKTYVLIAPNMWLEWPGGIPSKEPSPRDNLQSESGKESELEKDMDRRLKEQRRKK